MKFRKKPVEIEAWLWLNNPEQEPAPEWIKEAAKLWPSVGGVIWEVDTSTNFARMLIATLEGVETATPGYYIVKGIKGELYPCRPDIFEQSYDKVE